MESWPGCRDLAEPKKHLADQRPASVLRFPGVRLVLPTYEPAHPGNIARRMRKLRDLAITWLLPACVIALAFALFMVADGVRW